MEVNCAHCSARLTRSPSHVRTLNFCDAVCRKAHSRPALKCAGCGVTMLRNPSAPNTKYCSFDCFKGSRWAGVTCHQCGVGYLKRVSEISKMKSGAKHMCSRSCRNIFTSILLGGDGSWVVGGKHGEARNRGAEWKRNRMAALERDEGICQQCGGSELLEVHHWEPREVSCDDSLENLVTLCRDCHQDKHREYVREGFYEDVVRDAAWV